ncbi:MAG: DUF3048 domain-containing protein [Clostridiales bacterium]|nr:DUF3048 domain-containing protein [Clostridiales bacterium]
MKKRICTILMLILAAAIIVACKKKATDEEIKPDEIERPEITVTATPTPVTEEPSPTAEPEESYEGMMRSYLTGLWIPVELGTKRPYAIQFNNFKTVKNQWGIGQADIVYECLVEGGLTRLLGIGQNFSGDKLGSVRSARHYFVSILEEYDAIYIHYGKTKYATSKMNKLGTDHMDGTTGIGNIVYYRDKSIKAPHNAFTSLERIQEGIKKQKFRTELEDDYQPHFKFYEKDTDLVSGSKANKINIRFSASAQPYFEYNSEDKLYYRFQYGDVHKDSLTGEQLNFKNVIIQFVKEWNIDKNGYQTMDLEDAKGEGYYFTNGKVVPITWRKKEATNWMRYYNEAGEELTINPGKTFIILFPNNRTKDVKFSE